MASIAPIDLANTVRELFPDHNMYVTIAEARNIVHEMLICYPITANLTLAAFMAGQPITADALITAAHRWAHRIVTGFDLLTAADDNEFRTYCHDLKERDEETPDNL
jgi:hypothetical protein